MRLYDALISISKAQDDVLRFQFQQYILRNIQKTSFGEIDMENIAN